MNTFELIDELTKKSTEEIKYALLTLMLKGKINFLDLNASYVDSLKEINDEKESLLIESDICVMQMMFFAEKKKKLSKLENTIVQRGLYRINQSNRFNTKSINEKLHYIGDDKAKE